MLVQLRPEASAFPKQHQVDFYTIAIGITVFLGIALRLFHYFYNRSLWTDEIYLSAGIVDMSFKDLLSKPLPYMQKAPVGYLLMSHLFVVLFGKNEMALRLYSLLTSIISLFLFLPVARYFLKPLGVVVALSLLAIASPIIHHSVEAKPYGADLFTTVLILWLYVRYHRETDLKNLLLWGFWGGLTVWLSYPSIFVLAGIVLATGIYYLLEGNWKLILGLIIPSSIWLVSFALSYLLFAKEGSDAGWLVYFFVKFDGYFPLQPVSGVTWAVRKAFAFFHYPLGLTWINDLGNHTNTQRFIQRMTIVPLVLSCFGTLYFFKQDKKYLVLLGATVLITFVASSLKLYPFYERMTVFLAPLVALLLAGGSDYLNNKKAAVKYFGYGLSVLLLLGLVKNTVANTFTPYLIGGYKMSYYRDALQYVNSNYRDGDAVYVYWNSAAGYKYYKAINALKYNGVIGGDYRHEVRSYPDFFAKIDADLAALPNKKRAWIIYSSMDMNQGDYAGEPAWFYNGHDFREGYGVDRFIQHLGQVGKIMDTYVPADGNTKNDVHVHLMELK
ncbi:glycosyltransferase family 39 protein [Hymenobacter volaticus]|uniref:Glycosyltransferase family 39 protein n=1 Tax=Hymenobacter volaticus TaxID=2932254 RepID=A0ABY4G9P2_9BACT|nr:glycosyltransferase family 39 protein [Hymenobacter volaticus]UOQ67490.1 glycosyltransferase family 39 protein [Hymenobacter volaticus]